MCSAGSQVHGLAFSSFKSTSSPAALAPELAPAGAPARWCGELAGKRNTSERMGTMDATMGLESSERVPVFAEAQVQPRSAANLTDLRK